MKVLVSVGGTISSMIHNINYMNMEEWFGLSFLGGILMSVNITFLALNVNGQYRNSAVAIGESTQTAWSAHAKRNYGNGMIFGWNNSANMLNTISDNDPIDTPITDLDAIRSFQNQNM